VAIILQSSVGGFSDEFMRKLPAVERAMIERGLRSVGLRDVKGPRFAVGAVRDRPVLSPIYSVV
jgi:hypothetical protein